MKDFKDPKYNHCLRKEIVNMQPVGFIPYEDKNRFGGLLTNGKAPIGTPVELFIKLIETRKFREYSIHSFEDREGMIITFYGTVKNTPVKMEDVTVGDCIKVKGRIAKYGQWNKKNQTRISHVKIILNKGKKVEKSS